MVTHLVLNAISAGESVTAEDVKAVLLEYAAEHFGGRCEVASAVFSLTGAEPEMLVVIPGTTPPRLIPFDPVLS